MLWNRPPCCGPAVLTMILPTPPVSRKVVGKHNVRSKDPTVNSKWSQNPGASGVFRPHQVVHFKNFRGFHIVFFDPFLGKDTFYQPCIWLLFSVLFLGGARSQEPSFSDNGFQDSKLPSISIWFTATLLASFRPWKPHLPPTSIFQTCWPTKITPNSKGTNKSSLTQLSSHVNQPKWSNQPTSKKWIQNGLVSHWDLKFDRSQEALEKSFQQVVPWISPKKMYRGGVFWRDDPGTSCEPQKKLRPRTSWEVFDLYNA